MPGILQLLGTKGLDETLETRMVRHAGRKHPISTFEQEDWLEEFQQRQSSPIFRECEQLISFVGGKGTTARFVGVYKIIRERDDSPFPLPKGCDHPEWLSYPYYYETVRDPRFDVFTGRLIEWGPGARAWVQKLKEKNLVG